MPFDTWVRAMPGERSSSPCEPVLPLRPGVGRVRPVDTVFAHGTSNGSVAMSSDQRKALLLIAGAQLAALTLWFSASAVAPSLEVAWGLGPAPVSALTLAVQLGFVLGALGLAASGIPDAINSRVVFAVAAMSLRPSLRPAVSR